MTTPRDAAIIAGMDEDTADLYARVVAERDAALEALADTEADPHVCEDCGDTRSPDDHTCPNLDCPSNA